MTLTRLIAVVLTLILVTGPAQAEPKDGQKFKDWTARCEAPPGSDKEQCYIFQNLVIKKDNKTVMHVAVGYMLNTDSPAAIVTLPLGVSLPAGIAFQVEDGEELRFAYERCDASGCLGGLNLETGTLQAMRAGTTARVLFHDGQRRPVQLPISLLGFTAGFRSLK